MPTMLEYEEAIRTRVCAHCIDRTGRGICGTQQWNDCALNRYLPEIVRIVNTVKSDSLDEYVLRLRSVICVTCKENDQGVCRLRNELDCALDRYYPLIVQTIEEVNTRSVVA